MTLISECCMCKATQANLNIVRNPWGDIHIVCTPCLPKWKVFWSEEE